MAQKKATLSYDKLIVDIRKKDFKQVYFLMGDESFYIEKIADAIVSSALTPEEREFNLITLYGQNTDVTSVISAARRYPMMSERQVVLVRELQLIDHFADHIDEFASYLKKPLASTILVLCHSGVSERCRKLFSEFENCAQVYESSKISESQLPGFISTYLKGKGVSIEPEAVSLIAEYVGNDAGRLVGELDKLSVSVARGGRVTPDTVASCIGVSREYNIFELKNAILSGDVLRVNRIVNYFDKNPKQNPVQPVFAFLFKYFSNLMQVYYAPDKSERGIASWMGFRWPAQARDYIVGMRRFSGIKTMQIISAIRRADARSKGIDNSVAPDIGILSELLYFIMH